MTHPTLRRLVLAAAAAATLAGTVPASAQYYRDRDYGYDRPPPPPRGYYRDRYDDDDDRPPPRRRVFGGRGGSVCVTARGSCPYPPAPFNAGCGCDIPGFGYKRGAIGG